AVLNTGLVSPGHSPGVDNVSSYTQSAGGTLQIELGGSSAGTGAGHYDQINVSGNATLDGKLALSLIDGFKPTDGQQFTFMTYGSVSGHFSSSQGFVQSAGTDTYYFEIKQTGDTNTAGAVVLTAHKLNATAGLLIGAIDSATPTGLTGTIKDGVGQLINAGYFQSSGPLNFGATALDLGQGLHLSGNFSLGYMADADLGDGAGRAHDILLLGLHDGSGVLGSLDAAKPGIAFSDADIGIAYIADASRADSGWVLGEGTVTGLTLQGTSGLSLTANQLTLDFAVGVGPGASASSPDLSAHPLSFGGASNAPTFTLDAPATDVTRVALSAHQGTLTVLGDITVSGDFGFSVADNQLVAAGHDVSVRLEGSGMSGGIDHGTFGLSVSGSAGSTLTISPADPASTVVVGGNDGEGSGALYLSDASLANIQSG
ncbi:hypothetical protein, partial [Pseudacidovorax intermedius]